MSRVDPENAPLPPDGKSELSWKAPVAAAILGALLVSAFVIYAIVTGPVEGVDAENGGQIEADGAALPSTDLPEGFVALPSGVGLKIQSVENIDSTPHVAISSAVNFHAGPGQPPPDEIAYWELETTGGTEIMSAQVTRRDAPGVTTVAFQQQLPGDLQHIVAYVATESSQQATVVESQEHITGEPATFTIDMADGAVLSGTVWVGDGSGFVEWSVDGVMPAKVDVIVTLFETTDLSTEQSVEVRLGPRYQLSAAEGADSAATAPLYGFNGRYELSPSQGESFDLEATTAVSIEIRTDTVTEVTSGVAVPFPTSD